MALCIESSSVTDDPSVASPYLTLCRDGETKSAVTADAMGEEGGCEGCNPGSTAGEDESGVDVVRGVIAGEETPPTPAPTDTDEDKAAMEET
jgi:hypothetical protein